jgi:hypothetical protein
MFVDQFFIRFDGALEGKFIRLPGCEKVNTA